MTDKRRVRALLVVVVVLVAVAGNLAFARHELEAGTSRAPAAVALQKAVDVASGTTARCPDFRVTGWAGGTDITVRRLRARGLACGQARSIMRGWLTLPVDEQGRRVHGFRCSALPSNTEFNATCTRGSRRVTASYG